MHSKTVLKIRYSESGLSKILKKFNSIFFLFFRIIRKIKRAQDCVPVSFYFAEYLQKFTFFSESSLDLFWCFNSKIFLSFRAFAVGKARLIFYCWNLMKHAMIFKYFSLRNTTEKDLILCRKIWYYI